MPTADCCSPSTARSSTESKASIMRIIERRLEGTTVLELHGTLNSPAAAELLNATVRRVTRAGPSRLVLHLGNVPSIDAGGLGALVAAYGVVRRNGGTFRLARAAR